MSKVGRNDPCPCGSGKKYKQCCWNKRLPLGKRKFKASVISSGGRGGGGLGNQLPDLMERTFGEAIKGNDPLQLKKTLSGLIPGQSDMPNIDANKALKQYLKESEEAEKKNRSDESA